MSSVPESADSGYELEPLELASSWVAAALGPLEEAISSPERLIACFRDLGWDLPAGIAFLGIEPAKVSNVLSSLEAVSDLELAAPDATTASLRYAELAAATGVLIDGIYSKDAIQRIASSAFGTASGVAREFPKRLLDYLVIEAVSETNAPLFYALLTLGIIDFLSVPADPATFTSEHTRRIIVLDRIPKLVTDPAALFREVYQWGTPQSDLDVLLERLHDSLFVCGLDVALVSPSLERRTNLSAPAPAAPDGVGAGFELRRSHLPIRRVRTCRRGRPGTAGHPSASRGGRARARTLPVRDRVGDGGCAAGWR